MASNRPLLPIYSHLITPARRTNTFQGSQRPSNVIKLASSTISLNDGETPLNKTHVFSPIVNSQSPSSSNDHLLKYDIRRLRASLERKEEQISWWMEKSKNDNDKFEALKSRLEQTNRQNDLILQCVRSTLDGLTCINRSINVIFMQEDKENKLYDNEQDQLNEENFDENISLVLLSRLNDICIKLAKNIDLLIRTSVSSGVSSIKHSHPVQRHESNASSISKQSTDDVHDTTNIVYEEIIDKLNNDLDAMKIRLAEQELRTKNFEEELNQCKSAHLSAKITFDTQEKKLQEQLILKDKQIISIATNEHDVLRQLLDEKTTAFEHLNEEYELLMTKYQSEYNRNVDCMIKTDALHEHIRLLSETLAAKEINEEKLTTQQQQMKKLMTLLIPITPSSAINKKQNDKQTFGRKVKRHLRESFSSLVNHKQTSNNQ
ncbi:unnamed protein product [Rotaria sordida]|uniref:Uncharacterized protein n=1 Tax=Rotaria sordida TaxID=392033 RepID=A0A818Z7H7_9BILA|nr:unnamed protein product [Rotaria sordida]CAF1108779.1 unnamed protein product [Rotaria sordida]CAF3760094.1 unnamed protein product [Rotaria sordida]CAF3792729.1 unnamed protein product [Rotaria sordida]